MNSWKLALAAIALPSLAVASVPMTLTHSGRLIDVSGTPLSGTITLAVTLYDTDASGSGFWTRTYSGLTVEDGYYAVALVTDDAGAPLDTTDFADGQTWVGVTADGLALGSRQQLGSVPYALVAGDGGGSDFFCSDGGGMWCPDGATCTDGTCEAELGGASFSAATTCDALHTAEPSFPNGVYWLDPDGQGTGVAPFEAFCLMDDAGGGWTLVARVIGGSPHTLLYDSWNASSIGATSDYNLVGTSDTLFESYGKATGNAVLFYDATQTCGSTDNRLLITPSILSNGSLRDYLTTLPVAPDPANSTAANFVTPTFRNTSCLQPFNTNGNDSPFNGNRLGINLVSTDNASAFARFAMNRISYDNGVGGSITNDGSYGVGDLDVTGDGVNAWSGHVLTVFVK